MEYLNSILYKNIKLIEFTTFYSVNICMLPCSSGATFFGFPKNIMGSPCLIG